MLVHYSLVVTCTAQVMAFLVVASCVMLVQMMASVEIPVAAYTGAQELKLALASLPEIVGAIYSVPIREYKEHK